MPAPRSIAAEEAKPNVPKAKEASKTKNARPVRHRGLRIMGQAKCAKAEEEASYPTQLAAGAPRQRSR